MKFPFKQLFAAAILSAALPLITSAQCRYVKESKDAFTNEFVKKASNLAIGPWYWTITLEQRGEKYFIGMKILTSGDVRSALAQGEKILIKLENEKLIELTVPKDEPPVAQVLGNTVVTMWLTTVPVDLKTMKRLARSPITDVKTIVQGVDLVLPKVKNRQANAIMNSAACIIGDTSS